MDGDLKELIGGVTAETKAASGSGTFDAYVTKNCPQGSNASMSATLENVSFSTTPQPVTFSDGTEATMRLVANPSLRIGFFDGDGNGTVDTTDHFNQSSTIDLELTFVKFADLCQSGGTPLNCDDSNPCTDDACGAGVCAHVHNASACSVALAPCSGPVPGGAWRNHGRYVSALARAAEEAVSRGWMTEDEKDAIVSAGAVSGCGD